MIARALRRERDLMGGRPPRLGRRRRGAPLKSAGANAARTADYRPNLRPHGFRHPGKASIREDATVASLIEARQRLGTRALQADAIPQMAPRWHLNTQCAWVSFD